VVPGLEPVGKLAALGVRRVSAGGGVARAAYAAAQAAAEQLLSSGRYDLLLGPSGPDMNRLLS
jgi:2-methylisocitrate lyase-like PEP mutase family enzyme